jgi:hypothetical protein
MEWINAKEKVPTAHEKVLLYVENDGIYIGYRFDGRCIYVVSGIEVPYYKVLYWMPLPKCPV